MDGVGRIRSGALSFSGRIEALVLEGGADAEEVVVSGDSFEILSDPSDLQSVAKALDEAGVEYESDELEFVPTMKVDLDASGARTFLKLADALEDLDDVQNVYTNMTFSDEVAAQLDD